MTHLVQIDDEVREATDEEIAAIEALAIQEAAKQSDSVTKADAKAALLERLGITDEEAKLLLS